MAQPPRTPQSPQSPPPSDQRGARPGRRPNAVLVGAGLLVLVLVLALAAYFGVRAYLGDGEPAERPATSQGASLAEGSRTGVS